MTRIADPQIHFADMEFLTQGIDLDPILKEFRVPRRSAADGRLVRHDLQWV
jgi:hypothetical protein